MHHDSHQPMPRALSELPKGSSPAPCSSEAIGWVTLHTSLMPRQGQGSLCLSTPLTASTMPCAGLSLAPWELPSDRVSFTHAPCSKHSWAESSLSRRSDGAGLEMFQGEGTQSGRHLPLSWHCDPHFTILCTFSKSSGFRRERKICA